VSFSVRPQGVDACRIAAAWHGDGEAAAVFVQHLDRDGPAAAWQRVVHPFAPFDHRDSRSVQKLLGAEREEFVAVVKSVGVEVMDRAAALVSMAQGKRGADNRSTIGPERGGQGLHQPRLTGAQRAVQRNHGPVWQCPCEQ
jgi:hypothetical protein